MFATLIAIVVAVAAYLVLRRWVLPRFGVQT
jgi:hypothetical protein